MYKIKKTVRSLFMIKFLSFTLLFTLISATSVRADFPDVPADSEYHQSISALQELGIVQGYENGQFDQNRLVSRAEFLKMALLTERKAVRVHSPESEMPEFPGVENFKVTEPCFPDVQPGDWFAPYVCWSKAQGIVGGYPDGMFHPHQTVNVAEGAKMLAREKEVLTNAGHWANGYFQKMAPHTLPTSILRADQPLKRAEVAEMLWRYHLATDEQLENKASKILTWEGDQYLDLDYIGKTEHFVLGYLYAKDDKNVYGIEYENGNYLPKKVIGADLKSFKVYTEEVLYQGAQHGRIKFSVAADDLHLYVTGEQFPESAGGEFKMFDQVFQDEFIYLYGHDKQYAYLIRCYEGCHLAKRYNDSDAASFQPLDMYFSKDQNNVYYNYAGEKTDRSLDPIMSADSQSFERIKFSKEGESCRSVFSKDKNNFFIGSRQIPNFKVNSFELLHDYGIFFKDEDHVYRVIRENEGSLCFPDNAIRLEMADVKDFSPYGANYFATENIAYYIDYSGKVTQMQADIPTLKAFSSNYSLPDFVGSSENFVKDKNQVYYLGKALNGVDVETFHYTKSSNGTSGWSDKEKAYTWSELTEMAAL